MLKLHQNAHVDNLAAPVTIFITTPIFSSWLKLSRNLFLLFLIFFSLLEFLAGEKLQLY